MKYLVTGLGNIGEKYHDTRHNIGFMVLDALAEASNTVFEDRRYGFVATIKYRSRILILLKPSTFMNLSGNAVNYWLKKEKIDVSNLMVVSDDIALPFGTFRMRTRGGAGGHNGLDHIISVLGTDNWSRIRVGIGNQFSRGTQSRYVLDKMSQQEINMVKPSMETIIEMIRSFTTIGAELTMTKYNRLGKKDPEAAQKEKEQQTNAVKKSNNEPDNNPDR